jgi:UDP-glucose 4-epimerase
MKNVFVTGGAGYIGSHVVLELLQVGYEVTVFDNLEFGSEDAIKRIEKLTDKQVLFIRGDIRKPSDLSKAHWENISGVIHCAAYKNVSDSIKNPDAYYENNVVGSLNLLNAMQSHGISNIVFSSTCAVHGQPTSLPVKETDELKPISPYGRTKLAVEYMIQDFQPIGINSVILRYFNVAGAHSSGEIGENPSTQLNVIPRIFGKALGTYEFKMFGNDFDTPDGTQIRDYIHVMDLADAHVKAIEYVQNNSGSEVFGLSTGTGTSVLQLIKEIEHVTGKNVDFEVTDPVPGDPIQIYGDASKAHQKLGWKAKFGYKDIIADAWKWYQFNKQILPDS